MSASLDDFRHQRLGLAASAPDPVNDDDEAMVVDLGDGENEVKRKPGSPSLTIEHPDGSITINFGAVQRKPKAEKWFDNLVEDIDAWELGNIASKLITGIRADDDSRDQWVQDRARGMDLLGLKLNTPRGDLAASSNLLEGVSQVNHPLLLEAVLRFQANARGELLPADGPVKIRVDDLNTQQAAQQANPLMGNNGGPPLTEDDDSQAQLLETAFNHYLTAVAKEYVPDTDRMLFLLGFGGCAFKKVYNCPIRRRPVSESVDAAHIIVSNAATSLSNCARVTHEVKMRPSILKRMQMLGSYREVDLGYNTAEMPNAADETANEIQGVDTSQMQPDDADRVLWECFCELDIKGFEHKDKKGRVTGLPVPYVVTIDKVSQQILAIRRNWEPDDEMAMPKTYFVKYSFIPGFGFYDIGLLHILGNTTSAATAAWREMLDAGMFACFPGFLYAKPAGKQRTNQFRVPPGGGMPIETNGGPIGDAVMPLPYREPGPASMQLVDNITTTGQRIGGTAEIQIGEGKQDAPVGTTIAMIEQATKVMDAVHKRLHAAQAEEFQLLKDRFLEDPEAMWRFSKKQAKLWDKERFSAALENVDLVPQADPNTSSQMMRIMKAVAIKQLQAQNPTLYDPIAVDKRVLGVIGVSNPEALFNQNPQQGGDNGEAAKAQAALAAKQMDVQQKDTAHQREMMLAQQELQSKQAIAAAQLQQKMQSDQMAHQRDMLGLAQAQQFKHMDVGIAQADLAQKDRATQIAAAQHAATIQAQQDKTLADSQTKVFQNTQDNQTALQLTREKIQGELAQQHNQIQHDTQQDQADRQFQAQQHHEDLAFQSHEAEAGRQHASHENAQDREHGIVTAHQAHAHEAGMAQMGHQQGLEQAEQGHGHALEQKGLDHGFQRQEATESRKHDMAQNKVQLDHEKREKAEDRKIQARKINQGGLKNGTAIGKGPNPSKK